jgi:hypothetical protein
VLWTGFALTGPILMIVFRHKLAALEQRRIDRIVRRYARFPRLAAAYRRVGDAQGPDQVIGMALFIAVVLLAPAVSYLI